MRIKLVYTIFASILAVSIVYSVLSSGTLASSNNLEKATLYASPACACRVKTITLTLNDTGTTPITIAEIIVNGTSVTSHNFPPDHMQVTTDYLFDGKAIPIGGSTSFKLQIGNGFGETTLEIEVVSGAGKVYTAYAHLVD